MTVADTYTTNPVDRAARLLGVLSWQVTAAAVAGSTADFSISVAELR